MEIHTHTHTHIHPKNNLTEKTNDQEEISYDNN
jgi:hypothetical protein